MAGSSSGRSVGKNSNHDEQMDESFVGRLQKKGEDEKKEEKENRREGEISVGENRDAKSWPRLTLMLANRPGLIGPRVDRWTL